MFKWRHLRPLYIKESQWLFECMVIKKLSILYKTYCGDIYATFARGWRALEQSVNAEVRSLKLSLNILKHPIVVTKTNSKKKFTTLSHSTTWYIPGQTHETKAMHGVHGI